MNIKELRIGNIVRFVFPDKAETRPLTLRDFADVYGSEYPDDIDCFPVKPTEKQLLEFGFKKKVSESDEYSSTEYEKNLDKFSKMSICDDMSFGIETYSDSDSICFENDIIDSVHRLQNIWFALTGKELEIK